MNKSIIVEDISCLSLFRRKCHYLEWCGEIDLKRNSKYILAALNFLRKFRSNVGPGCNTLYNYRFQPYIFPKIFEKPHEAKKIVS